MNQFLHHLCCYCFAGVIWTFALEWLSSRNPKGHSKLKGGDRLLGIIIWPITLLLFLREVYRKSV